MKVKIKTWSQMASEFSVVGGVNPEIVTKGFWSGVERNYTKYMEERMSEDRIIDINDEYKWNGYLITEGMVDTTYRPEFEKLKLEYMQMRNLLLEVKDALIGSNFYENTFKDITELLDRMEHNKTKTVDDAYVEKASTAIANAINETNTEKTYKYLKSLMPITCIDRSVFGTESESVVTMNKLHKLSSISEDGSRWYSFPEFCSIFVKVDGTDFKTP